MAVMRLLQTRHERRMLLEARLRVSLLKTPKAKEIMEFPRHLEF